MINRPGVVPLEDDEKVVVFAPTDTGSKGLEGAISSLCTGPFASPLPSYSAFQTPAGFSAFGGFSSAFGEHNAFSDAAPSVEVREGSKNSSDAHNSKNKTPPLVLPKPSVTPQMQLAANIATARSRSPVDSCSDSGEEVVGRRKAFVKTYVKRHIAIASASESVPEPKVGARPSPLRRP